MNKAARNVEKPILMEKWPHRPIHLVCIGIMN